MIKKFDCPLCGEKKVAIQSSTYPDVIVHKCYGKVLNEVASYKDNMFVPIETFNKLSVCSKNFHIEKLKTMEEVWEVNQKLELGFTKESLNDWIVANKFNEYLVVKLLNTKVITHIIFLSDRLILGTSCFLSFNKRVPNINDSYEILEAITNAYIDKNPYNDFFKP